MNKSTRNLLIIFLVLVVIVYFFFRGKDKISTQKVDEKLFEADSSKIEKVEIIKTGGTIVLEKIGGTWMVTAPVNHPADTTAITPILSNLKNFKIESEISSNPAKYSTYLDSVNNTRVNVYQEGKMIGTFILGKSAMGGDNSYIQKEPGKEIFLASKLMQTNFTKAVKDFRNKLMFSVPSFQINSITFKSDDSLKYEFKMQKDTTGRWFIGADSIAKNTADGFLNLLANFNTEDFIDSVVTQFPAPSFTITIAGAVNLTVNMYKQKTDPVKYIMQVTNSKQLYECTASFATMFLKQRKDFIPEPPKEDKSKEKKK